MVIILASFARCWLTQRVDFTFFSADETSTKGVIFQIRAQLDATRNIFLFTKTQPSVLNMPGAQWF